MILGVSKILNFYGKAELQFFSEMSGRLRPLSTPSLNTILAYLFIYLLFVLLQHCFYTRGLYSLPIAKN
jgi:hypothetical protein